MMEAMDLPAVALVLIAVIGLAVGSFLNVVAHRVPLGMSLVRPASRCPTCETPVRARDNLPVLGWLLLHGRCRACGARISWRYPAVEAATAGLWLAAVLTAGTAVEATLHILLLTALVPLVLIDLEHRRLPNVLTGTTALLALATGLALDPSGEPVRLAAAAAAAAFLGVPALVRPGGMGMGDVKLAGVMGLCLGPSVAVALLGALLAGTLVGLALARRSTEGRRLALPFGPFLALGALVAVLAGEPLLRLYLETF